MNKILIMTNYLSNPDNWCKPQDRTFYVLFTIYVMTSSYIMIGLYYYYPETLDMLFWPLNIYNN